MCQDMDRKLAKWFEAKLDAKETFRKGIAMRTLNTTPRVLMRKIGGKNHEVNVGDVVVTEKGKRFYVTGWDDVQNFVHGTSMCEYKYFTSAPAEAFGCYFAEV